MLLGIPILRGVKLWGQGEAYLLSCRKGTPTQARPLQGLSILIGSSWPQRPQPIRVEGTKMAS